MYLLAPHTYNGWREHIHKALMISWMSFLTHYSAPHMEVKPSDFSVMAITQHKSHAKYQLKYAHISSTCERNISQESL